jgi:hypothetical protein
MIYHQNTINSFANTQKRKEESNLLTNSKGLPLLIYIGNFYQPINRRREMQFLRRQKKLKKDLTYVQDAIES